MLHSPLSHLECAFSKQRGRERERGDVRQSTLFALLHACFLLLPLLVWPPFISVESFSWTGAFVGGRECLSSQKREARRRILEFQGKEKEKFLFRVFLARDPE